MITFRFLSGTPKEHNKGYIDLLLLKFAGICQASFEGLLLKLSEVPVLHGMARPEGQPVVEGWVVCRSRCCTDFD